MRSQALSERSIVRSSLRRDRKVKRMRMSRTRTLRQAAALVAVFLHVGSALAQDQEAQSVQEMQAEQGARTAAAAAGEVGQRQTRSDVVANVAPLGRIDSRVQSRVQNRIRNRIDRSYDPRANATSPFEIATEGA